jgi:hypothetical protein
MDDKTGAQQNASIRKSVQLLVDAMTCLHESSSERQLDEFVNYVLAEVRSIHISMDMVNNGTPLTLRGMWIY